MLKFEIRNIIVDEEILDEDDLELVNSFGVERNWNARTNQIKINWRTTQTFRNRKGRNAR